MEENLRAFDDAGGGDADQPVQLRNMLDSLTEARNQILKDAEAARLEIDSTFAALTKSLLENVEQRKRELLRKVDAIKEDTLAPLAECRTNVESQLQWALDNKSEKQRVHNSFDDSSISGLCEIPKPCDIPSVSVRFNAMEMHQCLTGISCLGRVSYGEPIKIVECREKPGALAILWEESDIGCLLDEDNVQYRLQYCRGDVGADGQLEEEYRDAYVGPDTCCVVRNLRPGVDHSFRVCRIVDGMAMDEVEWSRARVAKTTVSPYEWESTGDDYSLSDERRIATKETQNPWTLHSNGGQFQRGHSLQFTILECGLSGQSSIGLGLGLTLEKIGEDGFPAQAGTVFVNSEGEIFVDGVQTTTCLPRHLPGRTLTFESEEEEARNDRMRLMITCDGKRVTYDWRVDNGGEGRCVYFFANFRYEGWRLTLVRDVSKPPEINFLSLSGPGHVLLLKLKSSMNGPGARAT